MTRWIAAIVTLLMVTLAMPRSGEAGILDFIWEMSGPQMLGLNHSCLYSPKEGKWVQCRMDLKSPLTVKRADIKSRGPYFGFSAGLYGSTGVDSSTQNYIWGEIWMLELAPALVVRSYPRDGTGDVQIHHGVGVAYERFFGGRTKNPAGSIDGFNKVAITLTPFDVTVKHVAFGVKMRLYPEGFTADQFKKGLPKASDRPFETTIGFTFSFVDH
jgi:hypothetical protein